jgi:uncharacterized membrane protein
MTASLVLSSLALGLILSLTCGLRAFLAPFAMACAQGLGWVDLGPNLAWIGSPLAIGTFGAAIVIEVLADKIPALDHAMDVMHTVLKPVTGALAAMALMGDTDPVFAAVAALATGGVVAGGTHFTKALVRLGSSTTTAGAGNPILSLLEDLAALGLTAAGTWGLSQLQ